jgi:large subunit ribosomal protein L30
MAAKVKITQLVSEVRSKVKQKRTLEALGIHGIRKFVVREKSATLDGMIRVVAHLVKVEEVK